MTDIFAVSFRLHDSGPDKASYNTRYDGVISKLKQINKFGDWKSTTSFHIIGSDLSADIIADQIYRSEHVHTSDQIIVIDLTLKTHATRGTVEDKAQLEKLLGFR